MKQLFKNNWFKLGILILVMSGSIYLLICPLCYYECFHGAMEDICIDNGYSLCLLISNLLGLTALFCITEAIIEELGNWSRGK